jgi:hypothetical protein
VNSIAVDTHAAAHRFKRTVVGGERGQIDDPRQSVRRLDMPRTNVA